MQPKDVRLKRLARNIDALAQKDEERLRQAREIAALRRRASTELYGICAGFVGSLNRHLSQCQVTLDPPDFREDTFIEDAPNLFQINARGRILQLEFTTTAELISTEDFRIPYTLQGSARAFNQQLLDRFLIEEQSIYYTLEKEKKWWRFFDPRTHRSGAVDEGYLLDLMEQLV